MNIIELHYKLAEARLVYGSSGNASILDRGRNYLRIKESGSRCDSPKTMQVGFGVNSDISNLDRKPSTDLPLHLAVYESNPEINCVIHTHSVHATAYSVRGHDLKTYVTGTAELFGKHVLCLPFDLNRDAKVMSLKYYANKYNAVLLARHGVIVWHKTPEGALALAEALEWSAQIAMLVESPLRPPYQMSAENVEAHQAWHRENYGQKP